VGAARAALAPGAGQGLAHGREPLRAEARDALEPAVVRRGLEILERADAEIVVQPLGRHPPDAGDGPQKLEGVAFPAQTLEHREAAERHDVGD